MESPVPNLMSRIARDFGFKAPKKAPVTVLSTSEIERRIGALIRELAPQPESIGDKIGEACKAALANFLLAAFYASVVDEDRTVAKFEHVLRGGAVIYKGAVEPYRGPDFGWYPSMSEHFADLSRYLGGGTRPEMDLAPAVYAAPLRQFNLTDDTTWY